MADEALVLCSTTWKRYDLLEKLISSAEAGDKKPDRIIIFDNGLNFSSANPKVEVYRPTMNLGVSNGDNFFFKNIEGFKIVSNDDVELFSNTLEVFWEARNLGDLLVTAGLPILNAFTLFSVNQKVIDTVGYFDESISPNYAYFEDNDFGRRINLAGLTRIDVPVSALHHTSATLESLTDKENQEHSRKFEIARKNYIHKWGNIPPRETITSPNEGLYHGYNVPQAITRVK